MARVRVTRYGRSMYRYSVRSYLTARAMATDQRDEHVYYDSDTRRVQATRCDHAGKLWVREAGGNAIVSCGRGMT